MSNSRLPLGFASVKEILISTLGGGMLVFGITGASPDARWLAVAGGLGLLGVPVAGSFFEKKD